MLDPYCAGTETCRIAFTCFAEDWTEYVAGTDRPLNDRYSLVARWSVNCRQHRYAIRRIKQGEP